jgi:hypothetical protein
MRRRRRRKRRRKEEQKEGERMKEEEKEGEGGGEKRHWHYLAHIQFVRQRHVLIARHNESRDGVEQTEHDDTSRCTSHAITRHHTPSHAIILATG